MTTLDVFRAPESVAVVGATDNPAKWGHWLARGAVAGAHRRRVHLVNTRGGQVLDHPALPDLDALPEVPDLVAFAVPAAALAAWCLPSRRARCARAARDHRGRRGRGRDR